MKTMTCKDMGGQCDMEMTANTSEEMLKKSENHIKEYHPEIAKKMASMSLKEKEEWKMNFMQKWNKMPD